MGALAVLQKFGQAFSLVRIEEGERIPRMGLHGGRQNVDADEGPKLVFVERRGKAAVA